MSPREVQGLQALAKAQGGSLSVNPNTGLVEAGFLEQALPIVAAAAATYFTAGAAAPALTAAFGATTGGILAGAGAGALIGGGSAALQNKDVGQGALYGGIGGAVAGGTGAYADAPNVLAGANPTAASIPSAAAAPVPTNAFSYTPSGEMVSSAYNPAITGAVSPTTGVVPPSPSGVGAAGADAAKTFYASSNPLTQTGILALPGFGAAAGDKTNMPGGEQYDPNNPMRWKLSNNFQGSTPVRPNPYYKADYSGYAGGGMVAMAPGGLAQIQSTMFPQSQQVNTQFATPTQMPTSAEVIRSDYEPVEDPYTGQPSHFEGGGSVKKKKPTFTSAAKLAAMDPYEASIAGLGNAEYGAQMPSSGVGMLAPQTKLGQLNLARGGISDLGGYSDGGRMLKGGGDGMSDSIPATIGNKQPARLADGEFVVPADVVSHLGNGSTDAGAKRLYAMMDKVRQARTGKKKQAPAVNPKRLMPA
jgi:hypothetical protein